jgi:hypothetical protein
VIIGIKNIIYCEQNKEIEYETATNMLIGMGERNG